MKALRVTMLALAASGLAACQTMSETWDGIKNFDLGMAQTNEQRDQAALPDVVCPQVKIVDDLSSLSEFADLSDPADYNLISRVTLAQTESNCQYDGNNAVVDLKLVFEGQIGPKGRAKPGDTPTFAYPFFIAVTNGNNEIKAKEVFGASVTYTAGAQGHTYYESLRQIIPVENAQEARDFNVLVGFQLSPEQLRYNRANMIPLRDEARRLEENLKEQVQIGSNNASTPLGLAAAQGTPGIKITPGYPEKAQPAPEPTPEPVKMASAKPAPRAIKNPPVNLLAARKPQRAELIPASAPAEPAPAPEPEATPAPVEQPAEAVDIPSGSSVVVPTETAPAPAPEPAADPAAMMPPPVEPVAPVAPTPIDPAMEPAPAPAAEPVAPTPPSEPEAAPAEEEHGSLDNKAIEVEQLAPAAGEEASGAAAIDLTAPME